MPRITAVAFFLLAIACSDDPATTDAGTDATVDGGDGGAACSPACSGSKPHCNTSSVCVACLNDGHCSGATPKCDADGECVACLTSADCTDPAAARCDPSTNTCKPCENNGQCPSNLSICDTSGSSGVCVECSGTDETPCGTKACDVAMKTCSTEDKGTVGRCEPCLSDAHCKRNDESSDRRRCVEVTFGSPAQSRGTYCLQERSTLSGDACQSVYSATKSATSLGGVTANYCAHREALTTCEAVLDYGEPCTTDDDCGVTGLDDGLCRNDGSTLKCTYGCAQSVDCSPTFSCNKGETPNYCCTEDGGMDADNCM